MEDLGMDKPHHRRFSRMLRRPLPAADVEDHFAPYHGPGRCVDANGYARDDHDYMLTGPDGTRCLWCLRLRRMEPLS